MGADPVTPLILYHLCSGHPSRKRVMPGGKCKLLFVSIMEAVRNISIGPTSLTERERDKEKEKERENPRVR